MDVKYIADREGSRGGFDFSNFSRNSMLLNNAITPSAEKYASTSAMNRTGPITKKTGTTICGVKCKDAVVLGADTRATAGYIVADKNCEKLHELAKNIWCAGAGTSADLEHTTALMASKLELLRMSTHREPRVCTALAMLSQMLFKYQGHVGCALVLGGTDVNGPQLYKCFAHGSTDRSPFAAMGSGSLCAEAQLEAGYKDNMTIEEGKFLVATAIRAGIMNDLGSGSNIDMIVIEKGKTTYLRNFEKPVEHLKRIPMVRGFQPGTTALLMEKIEEIKKKVTVVESTSEDVEMSSSA